MELVCHHPANEGLDFRFQDTVSEQVLRHYLSRAMVATMLYGDRFQEDLRMLLHVGVKYVAREETCWMPGRADYDRHAALRQAIRQAHEADPELVFEACVFETVCRGAEEIPIPAWVFEAFGMPAEERCFRYADMLFSNGLYRNQWGEDASVPDMTRRETQLYFYYRACVYIALGFEGLHLGQVYLIGAQDTGWACWQNVLNKIRAYAKAHARRGFVFINAHTHGLIGPDGRLLFDFHAYPYRGRSPSGAVKHRATEENPQPIELHVGYHDSIYGKSLGGLTYSGWRCESLPYFVELDNWNGYTPEKLDCPTESNEEYAWWGFDEISWFANQPRAYRAAWLRYVHDWVHSTDPAGYAQMPGSRTAALRGGAASEYFSQRTYHCNDPVFDPQGFGDEAAIRALWIQERTTDRDISPLF